MRRVLVAMSGGVDSSVSALLLRRAGCDVTGVFMRHGVPGNDRGCCSFDDAYDARRTADRLGIPFYSLNLEAEFGALVDRVVDEYAGGRTPNPCILCNRDLKFGRLFDFADAIGAATVATGHYARLEGGVLRRGLDADKDQSYVLFDVERLDRVEFPVGALRKDEVRTLAREAGLPVGDKPDSQDVCFVPGGDMGAFLSARTPMAPGDIVTGDGAVVGRHEGAARFTVGQRRGLGVAMGRPVYVRRVDTATNTVVVGDDPHSRGCTLRDVRWLAPPRPRADVQVRYRHAAAPATIEGVEVRFDAPVRAVTPGQAAVFYDGDRVLGGGWIASTAD